MDRIDLGESTSRRGWEISQLPSLRRASLFSETGGLLNASSSPAETDNRSEATPASALGTGLVSGALSQRDSVVVLLPVTELRRMGGEFSQQFVRPWSDTEQGIAWARSLLRTGRQVFVILTAGQFRQHYDQICRSLFDQEENLVLVIMQSPDDDVAGDGTLSPNEACLTLITLLPWTAVMSPADSFDAQGMLQLVRDTAGPIAIIASARPGTMEVLPGKRRSVRLGCSERLGNAGDVVLVAAGDAVTPTQQAAERLMQENINVAVINLRFMAPFDRRAFVRNVQDADRLFIVDCGPRSETLLTPLQGQVMRSLRSIGWPTRTAQIVLEGAVSPQRLEQHIRQIVLTVNPDSDRHARSLAAGELVADRPGGYLRIDAAHAVAAKPRRLERFGFSASSLRHEHEAVLTTQLTPQIEEWFQIYAEVGPRGRYLWQWCQHGARLTTLPCVPEELVQHVCETKVLSIMLCVLLDDVADEQGRETLLEILFRIIEPQAGVSLAGLPDADRRWAEVTQQLSATYHQRIREYPGYGNYEDVLEFDQQQYFNTMRYSSLLNRHLDLLNPTEHNLYLPHAMHMMSFSTLDLMCTPDFPKEDLGRLREGLWQLQCMGRVGNLLSTWRREIPQADFTSGVFARAVLNRDLTVGDLTSQPAEAVEQAVVDGRHERYFARRWHYHRHRYLRKTRELRSLDCQKLLEGNERFFRMHLGSRGLI